MMNLTRIFAGAAMAALAAATLVACGGGDSAPAASATVSGTAATGAAIVGGTVTFKCVAGTVAATSTLADGSFSVDVSGATLPCVARVAYTDGTGTAQKLHTVFLTSGTANLTPLTDLILAKLASGTAASAFDGFTADDGRSLTAAKLTAAIAAIKTYLGTLGVSVVNLPADPIASKFVAKVGTKDGDLVDKILEDLKAKLVTAHKSLADAESEVGSSGSSGGGGTTAGNLVVTAATNSARNGTYVPTTGLGSSTGTDIDITGQTSDGNFELDVLYTAGGAIKHAYVWYFVGSTISFFGCDNSVVAISCGNTVGYEPSLKQILFNSATLSAIDNVFPGPAFKASSGETIKISGSISAK